MNIEEIAKDLKKYITERTGKECKDAYLENFGKNVKDGTYRFYLPNVSPNYQVASFDQSHATTISFIVYAYATQKSNKSAISRLYAMAEEIQNIFAFKIFKNYNENVISARVVNSTPPSMVNNELYYIAIRVEVNMTNPYTKIYE
jgi:hypothetical protein